MHTINAFAIIGQAIKLWESGFEGDPLIEATKNANPLDADAVRCVVVSQTACLGTHATRTMKMTALRKVAILH